MGAPKFRADYEQLGMIASMFGEQAEAIKQTQSQLNGHLRVLQNGGWVGKAATAFYSEMNATVMPSVGRLAEALASAQSCVTNITIAIRQAESDAAAVLRVQDTAPVASATPVPVPKPTPPSNATPMPPGWRPLAPQSPAASPYQPGSWWQKALDTIEGIIEMIATISDWGPVVIHVFVSTWFRTGNKYRDMVIIRTPEWFKRLQDAAPRWLKPLFNLKRRVGLRENFTHIKAGKLIKEILDGAEEGAKKGAKEVAKKVAKKVPVLGWVLTGAEGVVAMMQMWTKNSKEYESYGLRKRAAARLVDAGIALLPTIGSVVGSVVGGAIGAKAAGAVGAAIGVGAGSAVPVKGTIVGGGVLGVACALVGGVLGSAAGSTLGGMGGEWVQQEIIDRGWRDDAIRWLAGESSTQAIAVTRMQPTRPAWSTPPLAPAFVR